jgi:hypothetical protein
MIHLSTLNTSYGQRKGWESKCQFDSQPLKVGNRLDLRACKWCAGGVPHIVEKFLTRGTTLFKTSP